MSKTFENNYVIELGIIM